MLEFRRALAVVLATVLPALRKGFCPELPKLATDKTKFTASKSRAIISIPSPSTPKT